MIRDRSKKRKKETNEKQRETKPNEKRHMETEEKREKRNRTGIDHILRGGEGW